MAVQLYNATLRNLEYRLRRFRDLIPEFLEDALYEIEPQIVKAIQNQLYQRGIDGMGRKIMDYQPYTYVTKAIKKRKGQPTTRVTLKDTGAFYSDMHIVYTGDGFYVTSADSKTEELRAKYGDAIFRLTNENFTRIVRVHLRRQLQREARKAINGE